MRERSNRIVFCLNDSELRKLNGKVEKSGLTRAAFLRKTCAEKEIKEQPHADMKEIISQLRRIGTNIHQVAVKANNLNFIDAPLYRENYEALQTLAGKIMEAIY